MVEGEEGSSSALNLSLLCSLWVRDSSQGDKGLPGKRREVRISREVESCCRRGLVVRGNPVVRKFCLARLGAGTLLPPCISPMLRAGGTRAASPSVPRQELFPQQSPKCWGPEQSLLLAPQPAFPSSLGMGLTLQSLSLSFGKAVGPGRLQCWGFLL